MPSSPDLSVSAVPLEAVDAVWGRMADVIERALGHACGDSTTMGQLHASVMRGDIVMWAVHDADDIYAVIMLEVQQRDAIRVLFIHLVAGREMPRWVDQVEQLLKDYRDLVGADTAETFSRDGMARRLLKRGWRRKATIMEMPT